MWLCASLKPGMAKRPREIERAIASWQGILDDATVPDRDESVADHPQGFDLWLHGSIVSIVPLLTSSASVMVLAYPPTDF